MKWLALAFIVVALASFILCGSTKSTATNGGVVVQCISFVVGGAFFLAACLILVIKIFESLT